MKFEIVSAKDHGMGNVPKEFYRRTDAKAGKKVTIAQGKVIPGVLLRLKRRINYTLVWMDWETLQKIGVVDSKAELSAMNVASLVGKDIKLKS